MVVYQYLIVIQVLDGDTLRSETLEKETLITQLREMLEQTSRKTFIRI